MSPTDEKFLKYWKKYSLMGKSKYALRAILLGVLMAFFMEFAFSFVWSNGSFTLKSLAQRMLILSIMAFFYGRYHWNVNEKRFQELIKPNPSPGSENITFSEDRESQ